MGDINLFIAFGAGVLSFISPCCLPLYPAFLSYLTGISVDKIKESNAIINRNALLHTFFFLIGFSLIFIFLGLSSTLIGKLFFKYKDIIRQLGAIITIIFGLVMVGILKPNFLMREKKITFKNRPSGYIGSILIGIGYSAGWTPCIGPILGVVLGLGLYTGEGLMYMIAYIFGFSIPFFVMSFFIGKSNWIKKYSSKITLFGGYIMIIMGVFLYFGWMTKITSYLNTFNGLLGF